MEDGAEGTTRDGIRSIQDNRVVRDDTARKGARTTEDELARACLGQRAGTREATIHRHILRAGNDGQVSEAIGDVDCLGDGTRDGRAELQGRIRRAAWEVEVSTRAEGGRITEDDRTTEEVGITGVRVDAVKDNRTAVGRTEGELTVGRTRARAGSDNGVDRQGRARGRSQRARAVDVQRQAAVSVEGDIRGGPEDTAVEGKAIGHEVSRSRAQGGHVVDDDSPTAEAELTRVIGTSGEGQGARGWARTRLVQLTIADERRSQRHVEARGVDGDGRIDRELREREARRSPQVELETTAVEDQAARRHRRRGVDAERTAVHDDARARGSATGEGEGTRGDHGIAGVGVGPREEQRARTRLGEAGSARDDAGDVHRGTRAEIRHVERRVDVEGDVLGEGQCAVELWRQTAAEGRDRVHVKGSVVAWGRGDRPHLDADADAGAINWTDTTAAIHDANVDVIPTRRGSGEATGGEVRVGRATEDRRPADDEATLVIEGLREGEGASREVDLANEALGHVVANLVGIGQVIGVQDREVVGDGRGDRGAGVDGGTSGGEAIEALVVEAEAATIEVERTRPDIGRAEGADGDRARIDREVTAEGIVTDEAEVAVAGLGQAARAGDVTRDGEIAATDVDSASTRDSDRAATKVQGLGTNEVEVTSNREVRRVRESHAGWTGRVERRAWTEGDGASARGERVVEVHDARPEDKAAGEGIGGAQSEATRADLGDRAGTL